jgi:hypothetical protein
MKFYICDVNSETVAKPNIAFLHKCAAEEFCYKRSNEYIKYVPFCVDGNYVVGDVAIIKGIPYQIEQRYGKDIIRDLALRKLTEREINALGIVLTDIERKRFIISKKNYNE